MRSSSNNRPAMVASTLAIYTSVSSDYKTRTLRAALDGAVEAAAQRRSTVRARRKVAYTWRLREVMAAHGLWQTTELQPLLAQRGVELSAAQVYRLAAARRGAVARPPWPRCRHLRLHPRRPNQRRRRAQAGHRPSPRPPSPSSADPDGPGSPTRASNDRLCVCCGLRTHHQATGVARRPLCADMCHTPRHPSRSLPRAADWSVPCQRWHRGASSSVRSLRRDPRGASVPRLWCRR